MRNSIRLIYLLSIAATEYIDETLRSQTSPVRIPICSDDARSCDQFLTYLCAHASNPLSYTAMSVWDGVGEVTQ